MTGINLMSLSGTGVFRTLQGIGRHWFGDVQFCIGSVNDVVHEGGRVEVG